MDERLETSKKLSYNEGRLVGFTEGKEKRYWLDNGKAILNKYKLNSVLSEQDFEFMMELLSHHPNYEQKIGVGVDRISIIQNPFYRNTRCFYITRIDGSGTDFSYIECASVSSLMKKFMGACRYEVYPFIVDFRDWTFRDTDELVCEYTGEVITKNNCHVDHKKPNTFKKLVDDFIKEYDLIIHHVDLDGDGQDNTYGNSFANRELGNAWFVYHARNSELQVVSRKANLSILKKGEK